MSCWRFDLRRKMLPYLEGQLFAPETKRLEKHLLDCDGCRGLLVRLRAGHQMALRLAPLTAKDGPSPDFERELGALERLTASSLTRPASWRDRIETLATPRMVTVLAALVVVQLGLLVVSNRGILLGERSHITVKTGTLDFSEFRQLSIPDLKFNTQPHVSTEGYVKDVHTDPEEGTVAFKLVETPGTAGSFVVCEIMSPIQMAAPREGSHVRVYGVARYDAQSDRKWYEVNPVLDIASLKP